MEDAGITGAGTTVGADTTNGGRMSRYDVNAQIEKAKKQNDERYWNNYGWLQQYSGYPIIGGYISQRMKTLEYEENQRYWNDYFRTTGIQRSSSRYPIRSGLYGHYSDGALEGFEASEAVMSLYSKWSRR